MSNRFYSISVYDKFGMVNAALAAGITTLKEAMGICSAIMAEEFERIRKEEGMSMDVYSGDEKIGTIEDEPSDDEPNPKL